MVGGETFYKEERHFHGVKKSLGGYLRGRKFNVTPAFCGFLDVHACHKCLCRNIMRSILSGPPAVHFHSVSEPTEL